jgi:hypothetical protein
MTYPKTPLEEARVVLKLRRRGLLCILASATLALGASASAITAMVTYDDAVPEAVLIGQWGMFAAFAFGFASGFIAWFGFACIYDAAQPCFIKAAALVTGEAAKDPLDVPPNPTSS